MKKYLVISALIFAPAPASAAPQVTASILPLQAIVANVMAGVATPSLLLKGKNSEHTAALNPEQLEQLNRSDVVFIIGAGLEYKLDQLSGSEAVGGKKFNSLVTAPGVKLLKLRQGGGFEPHEHHVAHEEAEHETLLPDYNAHIWLDPENAAAMTTAIAETLAQVDPANAARYHSNAAEYQKKLASLSTEITSATQAIQERPYIVFHDAYPYYEARYHLSDVGSISDASAASPSAQRLAEIRTKIKDSGAVCVFREPQYDQKFITVVSEAVEVKVGVLDPIGYDLSPGPGAYEEMMRALTRNLVACLTP